MGPSYSLSTVGMSNVPGQNLIELGGGSRGDQRSRSLSATNVDEMQFEEMKRGMKQCLVGNTNDQVLAFCPVWCQSREFLKI